MEYVEASARAAKAGGVPLFSLVSAQGASASVWAPEAKPFHPLFYTKVWVCGCDAKHPHCTHPASTCLTSRPGLQCKGLAEQAARAQALRLGASIFRPGLLLRGDLARGMERWVKLLPLVSKVEAADVAKVRAPMFFVWLGGRQCLGGRWGGHWQLLLLPRCPLAIVSSRMVLDVDLRGTACGPCPRTQVMIADAERRLAADKVGDETFEMKDIIRLAREG